MNDRGWLRMLEPIKRRIMMTVARAVIRAVNDSKGRQVLQIEIMKGELRDDVERMQEYGFTSVPKPGADAAVVFVGGDRAHGIVIAVEDRRYRLTGLAEGEVALHDDQGQKVHLTRTGIVVATALNLTATVGGSVSVTAPTITLVGAVNVTGSITATGEISDLNGSMTEMRGVYNGHNHAGSAGPTPTMT